MGLILSNSLSLGSIGGGGGKHNLGWFATPEALREAYPVGTDGDWCIVGTTDTIWVWDADSNDWVDTDQKGQVESVNGLTGVVVLAAEDVKAIPQLSSIPSATSENVNMIFQYKGTTDANYTHGYFYECVSDGQSPATYSWSQVDVQPAPDPLPSQTGNAGKVLTTNGTTASWTDISTSPSTMPQLLAANWSSNIQTVSVTGVTANNVVMVSPSPVSATEYAQCGILCTAQAAGTLTFTCTSVPTNDLTVNVVCF